MANQPVAAGQEILVVDADDQVIKGLDRLLTRVGLIVTGTPRPGSRPGPAAEQVLRGRAGRRRHPDARWRHRAPAVRARQIAAHLRRHHDRRASRTRPRSRRSGPALPTSCSRSPTSSPTCASAWSRRPPTSRRPADRNSLLRGGRRDPRGVPAPAARRRPAKTLNLEDRRQRARGGGRPATSMEAISVVLVDDDQQALAKLESGVDHRRRLAVSRRAHRRRGPGRGDCRQRPHIVMVKEDLPDLPGNHGGPHRQVQRPGRDPAALHAARQGAGESGEVKLVDSGRHHEPNRRPTAEPGQLVESPGRNPRGAPARRGRSGATCRRSDSATSNSCSATTASSR